MAEGCYGNSWPQQLLTAKSISWTMGMSWLPWTNPENSREHINPRTSKPSAKTIAALSTKHSPAPVEEDPWASYDPWMTPPKVAKTVAKPSATKSDLEALEQRLDLKLQNHQTKSDGDATMAIDDTRINQLEQRMQQLETNAQQQQQANLAQHTEVQHQLQQVQSQVAEQGQAFTNCWIRDSHSSSPKLSASWPRGLKLPNDGVGEPLPLRCVWGHGSCPLPSFSQT